MMKLMMSHPYQNELAVGLAAVRTAARICRLVQSRISTESLEKSDHSPVTIADFASQAVICHFLGEAFPTDSVIAEEDSLALKQPANQAFLSQIHDLIVKQYRVSTTDEICQWIDRGKLNNSSARFWTLDPIDGTKGFLRRDQFAISLALFVDGEIQLGVLGCPNLEAISSNRQSLFYALLGQGAYATRLEDDSETTPLRVSPTSNPSDARICESFESGHSSHSESSIIANTLGIKTAPVRMDSQAKYAMVAAAEADIYLRLPAKTGYFEKIWDHAGGVLIVTEAGGQVTDLRGKTLDFSHGHELRENRGIIVTNGKLHEAVLGAARSVTAETLRSKSN